MQEKQKIILRPEELDYFVLLKKLSTKERAKVGYQARLGKVHVYHSQYGDVVRREELVKAITTKKQTKPKSNGYQIDLSTNSRINCLYKRVAKMTKQNKDLVFSNNKLTRYTDQDGYMCINIKEFAKQQIKMLSKRLEIKEYLIWGALYDLLYKLYQEEKGE